MYGKGLRALSLATTVVLTGAFALVFFYAPNDAEPGVHPEDLLRARADGDRRAGGFIAGGVMAIAHLRTPRGRRSGTCVPTLRFICP